jgi:hypothetical protein
MSGSSVYVCAPKAEFASKLTAWTPNPKDNNGSSTNRPTGVHTGFQYFDTSISPARPIYWNGSGWVDASGTTV